MKRKHMILKITMRSLIVVLVLIYIVYPSYQLHLPSPKSKLSLAAVQRFAS